MLVATQGLFSMTIKANLKQNKVIFHSPIDSSPFHKVDTFLRGLTVRILSSNLKKGVKNERYC